MPDRAWWEEHWERMFMLGREAELGPKGQAYILERYGEIYGTGPEYLDDYDEYSDAFGFETETTSF